MRSFDPEAAGAHLGKQALLLLLIETHLEHWFDLFEDVRRQAPGEGPLHRLEGGLRFLRAGPSLEACLGLRRAFLRGDFEAELELLGERLEALEIELQGFRRGLRPPGPV